MSYQTSNCSEPTEDRRQTKNKKDRPYGLERRCVDPWWTVIIPESKRWSLYRRYASENERQRALDKFKRDVDAKGYEYRFAYLR